jgi:hypothetical protein
MLHLFRFQELLLSLTEIPMAFDGARALVGFGDDERAGLTKDLRQAISDSSSILKCNGYSSVRRL